MSNEQKTNWVHLVKDAQAHVGTDAVRRTIRQYGGGAWTMLDVPPHLLPDVEKALRHLAQPVAEMCRCGATEDKHLPRDGRLMCPAPLVRGDYFSPATKPGAKTAMARDALALVNALLDPEQYGHAVTAEVRDHARRVLGLAPVEMPSQPVHFTEPTFIAEAPAGAQMIAVGLKILVVAPGMAPCWLTPTGMVQVDMVHGVAERRQAEAKQHEVAP